MSADEPIPAVPDERLVNAAFGLVEPLLQSRGRRPVILGICGAQGSGKTTLANALVMHAGEKGRISAAISIDDLYLTRAEREALAEDIHPLLRTRGPPGTHDVELGLELIRGLRGGEAVALPQFDKSTDERLPEDRWPRALADCELLIFEGWCVGARPQPTPALREPINALEREEDPSGSWRRYVNAALAGPYQRLFAHVDVLVLLAAPDFDVVFDWRLQQETELRERSGPDAIGVMDAGAVGQFIQYYERLTWHILNEMPGRADLLVRLDKSRKPIAIERSP